MGVKLMFYKVEKYLQIYGMRTEFFDIVEIFKYGWRYFPMCLTDNIGKVRRVHHLCRKNPSLLSEIDSVSLVDWSCYIHSY